MMDVVETWSGKSATTLQTALRDSNEAFARRLGVAVRTVAAWHQAPEIVPRPEIQQALDTTYETAEEAVHRRFVALSRSREERVEAQALRVAIAVVVYDGAVFLVCRRGDGALTWQFPAGVVKPGGSAQTVAVQEAHAETGVHCSVREYLGSRLHPVTGVTADYYLCDFLAGEASNRDQVENLDVAWAPVSALTRFIPTDKLFPPVATALEGTGTA